MSRPSEIHTSPIDYTLLKGKSVIITGGASGLGEATSIKFAASGAYVTIADVQDQLGEALAKKITSDGGKASYVHCDVTDWESSVAAFKHAVNFSPKKTLDVAILYAGVIGEKKNIVEMVVESGEASLENGPRAPTCRAIDINLVGTYQSAFLALNYMRLPPSGEATDDTTNGTSPFKLDKSLVLISSMAGYIDYPDNSTYAAGKLGVRGLFRSARAQSSKVGVRMNLVAPWFVETPMTGFIKQGLEAAGLKQGQGFTFASKDQVVDTAAHCAVSDCDGRAYAVVPDGFADLQDDIGKGFGGDVILDLMKRRVEAGDMLPS